VQQRSPSNLTELESICREEREKLSKSFPRRLEAVITAKGASTKYSVKDLNTNVNVIFAFLCCINVQTKPVLALSLWGIVCRLMRGENILE
jgi:hypothetical protein